MTPLTVFKHLFLYYNYEHLCKLPFLNWRCFQIWKKNIRPQFSMQIRQFEYDRRRYIEGVLSSEIHIIFMA